MLAVCIVFIVISSVITANSIPINGNFPNEFVSIKPECSSNTSTPATITITSDLDLTVLVHCKDGYTENVEQGDDLVHYRATVHYSGNPTDQCLFKSNRNSDFYQIALEIYYLKNGVLQYKDAFLVTCTYSEYSENTQSSSKDIGDALVAPDQTYKHVHRVHTHELGSNLSATFTIEVLDKREKIVQQSVPLGDKIKLRVTMIAGPEEEKGFHVFNCDAEGSTGIKSFGFIREGCGDGVIVGRTVGFITSGLVAESPYFKAFKLYGSDIMHYVCHFYVCHEPCDGASCIHSLLNRRKRHADAAPHSRTKRRVHHTVQRIKDVAKEDL